MRFLGEIASLIFGKSLVKTFESFWDGDLPVFESEQEASSFLNTMIGRRTRIAPPGVLAGRMPREALSTPNDAPPASSGVQRPPNSMTPIVGAQTRGPSNQIAEYALTPRSALSNVGVIGVAFHT